MLAFLGRWTLRLVLFVVILSGLAFGTLFALTEAALHHHWTANHRAMSVAPAAAMAADGQRLAVSFGCTDCHGADLQGRYFLNDPNIARLWGPNLTRLVRGYSDADLEAIIRQGIRPDGRPLMVMPSDALSRLSDPELASIIAYLRTAEPAGPVRPAPQYGLVGRVGLLIGQFQTEPSMVAEARLRPLPDFGPETSHGRDLARTCVECHGPDLRGSEVSGAPDLAIAGAYSDADFVRLLHTGVATGGRHLPLMSETARTRFSSWPDADIAAVHAYLLERGTPPAIGRR